MLSSSKGAGASGTFFPRGSGEAPSGMPLVMVSAREGSS